MFQYLKRVIMGQPKNVVVIVGTTGVGKSQFSIELASKYNGEIINADSMQMYKNANIITNKHPINERQGVPHHVMNHVGWDEEYFIHRFKKEAEEKINDIHSRGKLPIIIGGTHYYLNSLLFNNKTITKEQENVELENRDTLTEEQLKILDGPSDLVFQTLKEKDPKVAEKFHPNDTRRIRRALEIYYITNKKTSEHYLHQVESGETKSSLNYKTLAFWVYSEKPVLDKRLDERVDNMLQSGGLDEINELYAYYKSLPETPDCERGVWQVIGFKEFLPWLESGKEDEALLKKSIEEMKIRTRQYAKKQVKWIKSLLAVDLAKEYKHQYSNGGQLYLLDATDLTRWDQNVLKRGFEVTHNFLNYTHKDIDPAPEHLKQLLPPREISEIEDETTSKEDQWKHYQCDTCLNSENEPLILVGSNQYEIHLKSRRHRSNISRGKRKREYEQWVRENSKQT